MLSLWVLRVELLFNRVKHEPILFCTAAEEHGHHLQMSHQAIRTAWKLKALDHQPTTRFRRCEEQCV